GILRVECKVVLSVALLDWIRKRQSSHVSEDEISSSDSRRGACNREIAILCERAQRICSEVNPFTAERELMGSMTDGHIVGDLPVGIFEGNQRVGAADIAESTAYADGGKIRERAKEITPNTKLRWC